MFGAQNIGDLAILRTIMNDIDPQNDWLNVSVASRDSLLRDSFGVNLINPFSFNGLWQLLAHDVFVIGGGGLYGHETHKYIRLILPVVFILKVIFRKNRNHSKTADEESEIRTGYNNIAACCKTTW